MNGGQADQRNRATSTSPPRRRPLLLLRRMGGQARIRLPQPQRRGRWAWRGRSSPWKLPAPDGGVEARSGAGRLATPSFSSPAETTSITSLLLARDSSRKPTCRRAVVKHHHRRRRPPVRPLVNQLLTGRQRSPSPAPRDVGKRIQRATAGTGKRLHPRAGRQGAETSVFGGRAARPGRGKGIINGILLQPGTRLAAPASRLFVQESIVEPVIRKNCATASARLRVGNPLDKNTDVGAINSAGPAREDPGARPPAGVEEGRRRMVQSAVQAAPPARPSWFAPHLLHRRGAVEPHRPGRDLRPGPSPC